MTARAFPRSLLIVPLLTVAVLAFSVVLRAGQRPLSFARVYGGPVAGQFCGRVQLAAEQAGLLRAVPGEELVISWQGKSDRIVRRLKTDSEGWADVCFAAGDGAAGQLEVRGPRQAEPYVQGLVDLALDRWLASVSRRQVFTELRHTGTERVRLSLSPPVLSVPFGARVRLEVTSPSPLELQLELEALDLLGDAPQSISQDQPVEFDVRAAGYQPVLTVRTCGGSCPEPGESGPGPFVSTAVFDVPVVPGSLTVSADPQRPDRLEIRSPVERESAYYAVVGPWGRGVGGRLPLELQPDGTALGHLERRLLPDISDRYLVVSSTPDGRTPALVGYPLDGQSATFDARDAFLLDGEPAARTGRHRVEARIRFTLGGYAVFSGLVCLALFGLHLRRAERELKQDLSRVGAAPTTRDRSLALPLLALFSLFFAFSLAVLWIVAR